MRHIVDRPVSRFGTSKTSETDEVPTAVRGDAPTPFPRAIRHPSFRIHHRVHAHVPSSSRPRKRPPLSKRSRSPGLSARTSPLCTFCTIYTLCTLGTIYTLGTPGTLGTLAPLAPFTSFPFPSRGGQDGSRMSTPALLSGRPRSPSPRRSHSPFPFPIPHSELSISPPFRMWHRILNARAFRIPGSFRMWKGLRVWRRIPKAFGILSGTRVQNVLLRSEGRASHSECLAAFRTPRLVHNAFSRSECVPYSG